MKWSVQVDVELTKGLRLISRTYFDFLFYCDKNELVLNYQYCLVDLMRFQNLLTCVNITKTCLYNFDPLKPHFYIVKLGFTGCTLFLLFLHKNIDCGYLLEPPRRGDSNEYPQSMF